MADGRHVNYGGKEINDGKSEFRVNREIGYNKEGVFDRIRNVNYGDRVRHVDYRDTEIKDGKEEFRMSREIRYDKERVFDRVRNLNCADKESNGKAEFGREIGYNKEGEFRRVRHVKYGDRESNDGKAEFGVSRETSYSKEGVFNRVRNMNYGDKESNGKAKFGVSREIGHNKEGVFDRVSNMYCGNKETNYGKPEFEAREIGYNKERVVDQVRDVDYGDKEITDGKAELEVSREIGYSKEGVFDQVGNGDMGRIVEDGNGSGVVRGRVRQKDVEERVAIMTGRRRSSDSETSYGGDRMRNCGVTGGSVDREPGELSSESGSDGGFDSKSHSKDTEIKSDMERIENGTQNTVLGTRKRNFTPSQVKSETKRIENGTQNTVLGTRKRNFTPIVWDMDDKESRKNLKSSKSPSLSSQPPLPPIPKIREMPHLVTDVDARRSPSPSKTSKIQMAKASPGKSNVEHDSHVSVAAGSSVEQTPPPHEEVKLVSSDQAAKTVEDEESVPMRNIRSSRWANDADSPADEGEISADENPKIKKRRTLYDSVEIRGQRKSVTPNVGDLMREESLGIRSRSSESDERVRSSGRDSYSSHDIDENDHMDIDGDHHYSGGSASQSDAESKDDSDSCGLPEPTLPPQRDVNMLQGCRSVDEFERLNKINEGTYGVVYRAQDKKTGEIVALKKVKMEKEREGFPLTSLREINILLSFHHPSIIDVKEVVVGSSLDSIFMVMEYMEHDLKGLMETMKQPFSQSEVKCLMLQLLEGTHYLHDNWVLHRDLKTSNLLLNNCGELKICDFGLARQYGSPLKPYTQLVVTLWYRAPELLLGSKQYSTAIDMWSLGCIMAEFLAKEPLFSGKSEIEQIDKIYRILGTPNDTIWPGFSKLPGVKVNFAKHQNNVLRKKFPPNSFTGAPVLSDAGFDLLSKLLTYDPEKRITAEAALKHEWFNEVPLPKSKDFMPTFPALHAQDRRVRRVMKSPDPLEEQRRKELQQGSLGTGGVFG